MATLIGFFCVLLAATLAHAQRQQGFISIDCGSPNFQYQDVDTGISYVSDEAYIITGINRNISSQYAYPINPNLPFPLSDLRSFPQGFKNCYSLNPSAGNGSLNLIRASFLYGNYDGLNRLPEFDLYLDVNLWFTVTFQSASHIITTEIITTALSDIIHVCLVDKGLGVPFISALELRPLDASIYATEFGRTSASLLLFQRLDIGQTNGTGRHQEDVYDRIWTSYISTAWDPLATSQVIHTFEDGYRVPYDVIRTAAKPQNGTASLELNWNANDSNSEFYVYLYFAEVEQLGRNQSRKFNVSWNGTPLFRSFSPRRNYSTILSNSKALVGKEHLISIYRTEDSTHPPILNAVEIFMIKHMDDLPTYSQDVDAIVDVKTTYQINKSWTGDPCGPKNFSWEGLKCSYNASFPRIISLNLSSSNLSGTLAASIAKFSLLESLNLKDNQLSGLVPSALLKRSDAGLLVLSFAEKSSDLSWEMRLRIAIDAAQDLKLCLEMELCRDSISHPQSTTSTDTSHHNQDRIYITSSSYFSSDHELSSNNTTHSLNAQSMTAPFPR
ncbi:hypothetical protein FEM48_Zijuj08G0005900 [Ziziphus jujuba var. spinosa]|uniref:Malectin-like domain-containing protein n=1 Tax=Ziziphus jujuba var. spinosa TaxID=714518 RepID=A0A978UVZ1_ZIZJJ|nr:hypothetical protein FEM48_Zijuj08G0005900 [Ziziphus jujuba var. spinosa]